MPTTPNLGIIHLQPQQFQPDLPINTALDQLDGAITGLFPVSITTTDVTLTAAQAAQTLFLPVTGAFTGNRTLIVPPKPHLFAVSHAGSGGYTLTVKTPSGTGVDLVQGTVAMLYCDSVKVIALTTATGAGGQAYDHGFRVKGSPAAGEALHEFTAARDFHLPAGLVGSVGKIAGITATSPATFPVRKNGVTVGSIIYPNTAARPTFTMASATDFLASVPDMLVILAPASSDPTLADIQVTLKGTRS